MTLNAQQIEDIAKMLIATRRARKTIPAISDRLNFDMDDAYLIQDRITAARTQSGEKIIGWKLGYTSQAMRKQMGIPDPNYGPLTEKMILRSGESISSELIQPKVEPEIGVKINKPIKGKVTFDQVLGCVESVYACLEIVDSVFTGYRFKIQDNTADGSSAAQFVVGSELPAGNLSEIPVAFYKNDEKVGEATGSAASGHPLNGIVWLAERLEKQGKYIAAGQMIITGGLTSAVDIRAGDKLYAKFGNSGSVTVFGPK